MFRNLYFYLENGLRVVIHRVPNIKLVTCGLWINQGSKHENESNSGISHIIEHLKINKNNEANMDLIKCFAEVVNNGIYYNAKTTKDNQRQPKKIPLLF